MAEAAGSELLDPATVVGYLQGRGVLPAGTGRARELAGGISNVVLAVDGQATRLVLKQSLAQLRVREEWSAPRERVLSEAAALRLCSTLTPGFVPAVVDVDPDRLTLTIERAPDEWSDWKTKLLAGSVDTEIGARLGDLLARWHGGTLAGAQMPDRLTRDTEAFRMLRTDSYHASVAAKHRELRPALMEVVDRMQERRLTLVHGDFSPKNVLVGPAGAMWVIDFEVAHLGDPVFDLAFLLSHLLLKSVHRRTDAARLDATAEAFLGAYVAHAANVPAVDLPYVSNQIACLLLARVDGKSPAEYLDAREREIVWRLGVELLAHPADDLKSIADMREQIIG